MSEPAATISWGQIVAPLIAAIGILSALLAKILPPILARRAEESRQLDHQASVGCRPDVIRRDMDVLTEEIGRIRQRQHDAASLIGCIQPMGDSMKTLENRVNRIEERVEKHSDEISEMGYMRGKLEKLDDRTERMESTLERLGDRLLGPRTP